MTEQAVRVAVVGTGSFGKNHLRVYHELQQSGQAVTLAAAVEPNAERADAVAQQYGIPVFASVAAMLSADARVNAASVTVPTVHHHAVAAELLDAGLDLLVEKPLASTLAEADDLIARAERTNRVLQPGHLERFNPAVLATQKKLRRPMFFESHRLSIFTPRALDVDVVLDLMIHDLDVVLTFAASPVREVRAVGLPILSPKVDIANVRVEFESGCVANFTASRVSTERVRKLRFFEPRQYVSIDYARQDLLMIRMDADTETEVGGVRIPTELAAMIAEAKIDPAILSQIATAGKAAPLLLLQLVASGKLDAAFVAKASEVWKNAQSAKNAEDAPNTQAGPAPGLSFVKPEVTPGEPLKLELSSFLESVRACREPHVTARQGREALALALEIQSTMAAHAERAGLADFFSASAN